MTKLLFWFSTAAIIYTYIGYPFAVWFLALLRNQKVFKAAITPRASVVVACHNEAANIKARIKNLLECDYPAELLEIIIVSDGSTDLTAEIARRAGSNRVRVLAYEAQQGKAVALNVGAEA
ncbi:MAG TPA: glycosyltransferase, partial [Blastocatellia bacterium]